MYNTEDPGRPDNVIAEAIYEALPQTPLLFLSQKEAKKLLKHKDFAFCGKRPRPPSA